MRDVFNFFKDLLAFDFKRRQNSIAQQRRSSITRFVRGNKPNVTEKQPGDSER
jgi:hypothetical protein